MKWSSILGCVFVVIHMISCILLSPALGTSLRPIRLRNEFVVVSKVESQKKFGINENGKPQEYITNDFEDRGEVVIDHATGLMWQKGGSSKKGSFALAQQFVERLNTEEFKGYSDWRLPTIEELLSLVEPERQANQIYVDAIFSKTQGTVWSDDHLTLHATWVVSFRSGLVNYYFHDKNRCYVRAVRSMQPDALSQQIIENSQLLVKYTTAIKSAPQDGENYYQRGIVYLRTRQYGNALMDFSKVIDVQPTFSEAYYERGKLYALLYQYPQALDDFNKALEYMPTSSPEVYVSRGDAYMNMGQLQEALDDFNTSIAMNPALPESYEYRAQVYAQLQDYTQAIRDHSSAIELDDDFIVAYTNRAYDYWNIHDYEKALDDCKNILSRNPKNAEAYYIQGLISLSTRKYMQAQEHFTMAIALKSDFGAAYYERFILHLAGNQCRNAWQDFRLAVDSGYHPEREAYDLLQKHCPHQ